MGWLQAQSSNGQDGRKPSHVAQFRAPNTSISKAALVPHGATVRRFDLIKALAAKWRIVPGSPDQYLSRMGTSESSGQAEAFIARWHVREGGRGRADYLAKVCVAHSLSPLFFHSRQRLTVSYDHQIGRQHETG